MHHFLLLEISLFSQSPLLFHPNEQFQVLLSQFPKPATFHDGFAPFIVRTRAFFLATLFMKSMGSMLFNGFLHHRSAYDINCIL
jgi:hypothetical protein